MSAQLAERAQVITTFRGMKVETKAFCILFRLFRTTLLGVGALLGVGYAQPLLGAVRALSYAQEGYIADVFRNYVGLAAVLRPGDLAYLPLEIPRTTVREEPYETWSLFLICNPDWLQWTSMEEFVALYKSIGSFGHVIGPTNLAIAVWFWKEHSLHWRKPDLPLPQVFILDSKDKGAKKLPAQEVSKREAASVIENIDVEHSVAFCRHYKLLPSEGPHVLVTKTYPELATPAGDFIVLKLNGLSPKSSSEMLSKLADQILVQGLDQKSLSHEERWRRMGDYLKSAISNMARVEIKAGKAGSFGVKILD